jgi:hypothetical protein
MPSRSVKSRQRLDESQVREIRAKCELNKKFIGRMAVKFKMSWSSIQHIHLRHTYSNISEF